MKHALQSNGRGNLAARKHSKRPAASRAGKRPASAEPVIPYDPLDPCSFELEHLPKLSAALTAMHRYCAKHSLDFDAVAADSVEMCIHSCETDASYLGAIVELFRLRPANGAAAAPVDSLEQWLRSMPAGANEELVVNVPVRLDPCWWGMVAEIMAEQNASLDAVMNYLTSDAEFYDAITSAAQADGPIAGLHGARGDRCRRDGDQRGMAARKGFAK